MSELNVMSAGVLGRLNLCECKNLICHIVGPCWPYSMHVPSPKSQVAREVLVARAVLAQVLVARAVPVARALLSKNALQQSTSRSSSSSTNSSFSVVVLDTW